jgi:hypothetical protein
MNKTKLSRITTMMMLSVMLMVSFLYVSLLSEKDAEATICFDCPKANEHLDEAKKSLDSDDTEGAKKHIDAAKGLLENSTSK